MAFFLGLLRAIGGNARVSNGRTETVERPLETDMYNRLYSINKQDPKLHS